MNRKALVFTSLATTFALLLFLSEVRGKLNGAKEHQELAQFWKSRVAREQLKKLIVRGQFADFKQDVALLIPDLLKKSKISNEKKKLRSLASVIPHESTHEITLGYSAKELLTQGKALLKDREYSKGRKLLKKLIRKFPDTYHTVEAHYLIVEAYAQQKDSEKVVEWVDKMVEIFPEDRMTGYALLRVASIYEDDGRPDDAIRIYRTIVAVYDDKGLVAQAQRAVSELRL